MSTSTTERSTILDKTRTNLENVYARFEGQRLDAEERLLRIELARRGSAEFCAYVMTDEEGNPWDAVTGFQAEWCGAMDAAAKRYNVIGPKKHAKSSTLCVGDSLFELGRDPEQKIKVVSSTDREAKKRGVAILQNIQFNARVREVFPDLKVMGKDPSPTSFYLECKNLSGEPSVECYGWSSSSTGGMANRLIFDDVVDARNSIVNPSMRAEVKEVCHTNWLPMLLPGGVAVNLSNAWHVADWSQGLRDNPEWETWESAAVVATCEGCGAVWKHDPPETGPCEAVCARCERPARVECLWPGKWDIETLQSLKRELMLSAWRRMYMCEAVSDEEAMFLAQAVEDAKREMPAPGFENARWGAGVDLARSAEGNYFVVLVGCQTADGQKHLVAMTRRRGVRFPAQVGEISAAYEEFPLDGIKVESNGYQRVILDELEDKRLPVTGYTTTAVSKRDLELGIPGLASEVERGEWTIWDAAGELAPVVDEAKAYPNGEHDDTVMAWLFLRELFRTRRMRGAAPKAVTKNVLGRRFGPVRRSPFKRPMGV